MSRNSAAYWIDKLGLEKHPEGGYYKETFRDTQDMDTPSGKRSVSTAIYFLLEEKDISAFHRIKSDELWFYHDGGSAVIYTLDEDGEKKEHHIGTGIANGESLQVAIPRNCWFGAKVKSGSGFILVSCTVAPGFDFDDFELANKTELTEKYPQHKGLIAEMAI